MNYIQIIFDILLTLIGLYLAFGKSYFTEKGKNLATKEDIGIITREIETVKNEISFSTQRKIEFLREQKEVALAFNNDAAFLVDYASNLIDIISNNSNDLEIISRQKEEIRLQGSKVVSSFLKIYIYFDEGNLTIAAENYYNTLKNIQQLAIALLFTLEQSAQKETILMDSFKNGQIQHKDELISLSKNRKALMENHIIERQKLLNNEVYKMRGLYINEISLMMKT